MRGFGARRTKQRGISGQLSASMSTLLNISFQPALPSPSGSLGTNSARNLNGSDKYEREIMSVEL
jgi:hypothetical protein